MTNSTSNCVEISRHTHFDGNETEYFDDTQNIADYLNSLLAVQGIEPNPGPTEDKVVVGDKRLMSTQDLVLGRCRDRVEITVHEPVEEKFEHILKDKRPSTRATGQFAETHSKIISDDVRDADIGAYNNLRRRLLSRSKEQTPKKLATNANYDSWEAEKPSTNSPDFSNIFDSPVDVEQDNMTGDTIKTINVLNKHNKNNKKKSKKNPPVKRDGKKDKKTCKYEIADVSTDQQMCMESAMSHTGKHIVKLDATPGESENPSVLRSNFLKPSKTRQKMDDSFKKDSQMLEKLIHKINEYSDVKFVPLGQKQDAQTPVEIPKTRSLTVAKFRAQFNRNCTLLPNIGETASQEELGCVIPVEEQAIPGDKNGQKYNKNFLNKMEYIRQKTLRDYIKKLEETKKRAESLFGIERCHGSHELNTALLSDPYADIKLEYLSLFASKSPKGAKPKQARLGRRFKRARQSEQAALRKRIEQQALYTPYAPAEIREKIVKRTFH